MSFSLLSMTTGKKRISLLNKLKEPVGRVSSCGICIGIHLLLWITLLSAARRKSEFTGGCIAN